MGSTVANHLLVQLSLLDEIESLEIGPGSRKIVLLGVTFVMWLRDEVILQVHSDGLRRRRPERRARRGQVRFGRRVAGDRINTVGTVTCHHQFGTCRCEARILNAVRRR
jgi:hypothetical protein